ncbi:MAG: hypothetical protein ACE5JF_02740 [Anaerolineales bacterium]
MTLALVAGAISGIAGLLVFLTVHHFWILPIWFIFPPGALLAALGGMVELLVLSTAIGALLGWLFGRTREASVATALAGLVFALGPGPNIPLLGGTPGTMKGLAILLLVIVVSAVVLVEIEWRLRGGGLGELEAF